MNMVTIKPTLIEVDHDGGVIYVHDASSGKTILRICNLPTIPKTDDLLDITHMIGCSWQLSNQTKK